MRQSRAFGIGRHLSLFLPRRAISLLRTGGPFLLLLAPLFILAACTQQPAPAPTPPARLTPTPGVTAQELTALMAQQQELTRAVAELRARLENQTQFSQASLDALRKRVEVLAGQSDELTPVLQLAPHFRFRGELLGRPYGDQLLVVEPMLDSSDLDIWLKPSGKSCAARLYWAASSQLPAQKPMLNYIIETGECHREAGPRIAHLSETWGTDKAMPIVWGFSSFDTGSLWVAMTLKPIPSMESATFEFLPSIDSVDFHLNPAKHFVVEGHAESADCGVDRRGQLYVRFRETGDQLMVCLKKADDSYAWTPATPP